MPNLSPKLPLQISDIDGSYKTIKEYKELVKQNLKNIVLTNPGEKTMDGNFGVGVKRLLFENYHNLDMVHSEISARVIEQTGKYLSYVDIYNVAVKQEEQHAIRITISYFITPLGASDQFDVVYETN